MANLQWLKLSTDFFDNNKIKLLESEKDGDIIIRVWIQLLITAKNLLIINAGIAIYLMNEDLTLEEAFVVARETIDSGRAYKKYEEYRNASVSL